MGNVVNGENKINIPFSPPDISEAEVELVAEALRSGWITTGPKTKLLEKKIAEWVGTPKAVCLNSQTACAETALRILGIGAGDDVIVPAYTYTATASVVCHVGAKIVMVDCQKDSLEMDYDALEAAITENTKVIIPVDLGGIPCDYDRIFEIVERKKAMFKPANEIQTKLGRITVVADAAHAFGAEWHGQMVGSIADFTNFSFHAVKNFTTAEGGAMTWRHIDGIDDEAIYKQATRVGRIIRETSIDELPQILNILCGQMSFIGPRAGDVESKDTYEDDEKDKLLIRPGLTGYTQAYYRNNLGVREKRLYDAWYAHNVSFGLDIKIFFKTIQTVLLRKNVYTNDVKTETPVTDEQKEVTEVK